MRWKGICAYDGTDLLGWQSQVGGNTVQDFLEARLKEIFNKNIRVHGSARTDTGVHAKGQVFHFDADWKHGKTKLLNAIRVGIPKSIHIVDIKEVSDDFHARYSVKGKRYVYYIYEGYALPTEARYIWSIGEAKLDIKAMQKAASLLIGVHDFTAFSGTTRDKQKDNPIKEIWRFDVVKRGKRIRIITEGSGYLYKMVRSIVGALVDIGLGKLTVEDLAQILKSQKRTPKVVTASAKGLFLDKVFY